MKIILIGSGNVAYNMANLFAQNNITVTQVISRNAITGKHVATICGATYNNNITTIPGNTTVIVITTQDANIKSVVDTLPTTNAVIIHTSGTTPINAVANKSPNYGILYPLQSLMYGVNKIPEIAFLVQASNISTSNLLLKFASTLGCKATVANPKQMQHIHIAAVIVNNFTNHLYTLAYHYCLSNHISFDVLLALVHHTANRLTKGINPVTLQTGPAIRNDNVTIQTHQALLASNLPLLQLYNAFTESIKNEVLLREKPNI